MRLAARWSRTFHLTPVGVAAYELGQSVLDRFFLRLDARIVTFPVGSRDDGRSLPGRLRRGLVRHPAGPVAGELGRAGGPQASAPFGLYVYRGDGRRSYRALLRALAGLVPRRAQTIVVVASTRPSAAKWLPRAVPRQAADPGHALRVRPTEQELAPALRGGGGHGAALPGWRVAVCHGRGSGGLRLPGRRARPASAARLPRRGGAGGAVFSPSESGSMRARDHARRLAERVRRPSSEEAPTPRHTP